MIPDSFRYLRAQSVDDAVALLAEHGEDTKLLAGGHSLLPLMKLRLAAPELVIDLTALRELSFVEDAGDAVRIGALTRHHDLANSDLLAREVPLLAHAAGTIGDPQVRHRGTIGGSIVHGDAAADLPAVALALDAALVLRGPDGSREVAAREFFVDFFETALEPGEILTEIRVPKHTGGWDFQKFTRRAIDWAVVGVAVAGDAVALVNMGPTPMRASAVEAALVAGASPAEAAEHAAEGTSPADEPEASAEYRQHLAKVLVRRALEHSRG